MRFYWFPMSKMKFLKPYKDTIIVINVLVPSQEKHYQNSCVWRIFSFENKHKKNRTSWDQNHRAGRDLQGWLSPLLAVQERDILPEFPNQ